MTCEASSRRLVAAQITEQDGSTTVGGDLLPSAYFTMEQKAGSVSMPSRGKGIWTWMLE